MNTVFPFSEFALWRDRAKRRAMLWGHGVVHGLGISNASCNAGNAYNSGRRACASVPGESGVHQVPEHSDDQEKRQVNGIM